MGPVLVAIFGGVLRFTGLGRPHAVVFDETYYAKDAYALLRYGAERAMLGDSDNPIADKRLIAGDLDIFRRCADYDQCASYVAHPPLGKWMIGAGEWLFGMNPFGWRFAAALVGTLSILMLARVARRMTRSTLLGCFAGLLLALDGLHFVLSRTALLDIFLMFWVLVGFACLVVDRDKARERLVDWWESAAVSTTGPRLGLRPWRIASRPLPGRGVRGQVVGGLLPDRVRGPRLRVGHGGARRAIGLREPYRGAFSHDLPCGGGRVRRRARARVRAVVDRLVRHRQPAGGRGWDQATSSGPLFFVVDSARSWLKYHFQVLGYHSGLDLHHPYMSEPWTWPVLFRPVSFHYPTGLPPSACGGRRLLAGRDRGRHPRPLVRGRARPAGLRRLVCHRA
ncbi:phospholipid carrier-dependent glycosyltransferase [Nonomuraea ferruginea]